MRKAASRISPVKRPHGLSKSLIQNQFSGMEVDFDDKVTLFPVSVEQQSKGNGRVQRLRIK